MFGSRTTPSPKFHTFPTPSQVLVVRLLPSRDSDPHVPLGVGVWCGHGTTINGSHCDIPSSQPWAAEPAVKAWKPGEREARLGVTSAGWHSVALARTRLEGADLHHGSLGITSTCRYGLWPGAGQGGR